MIYAPLLRRATHGLLLVLLIAFLSCSGCPKEKETAETGAVTEKQVAEQEASRFQAHDETPASQKFRLTPEELAGLTSEVSMQKVLLMPHRVAVELLGVSHQYESTLSHTITITGIPGTADEKRVAVETQKVQYDVRTNSYHVRFVPQEGFGIDIYADPARVLSRMEEGPFNQADARTTKGEFFREKATGNLERFYRYFRGHITFSSGATETYEGRTVQKIVMTLDSQGHTVPEPLPVTTRTADLYRLSMKSMARTIETDREGIETFMPITGAIWVDTTTGVPLKGELKTGFTKHIKGSAKMVLTYDLVFAYQGLGQDPGLVLPQAQSIVDQVERRRMSPGTVFKDMPKDLREKSGVDLPRPLVVPTTGGPAPSQTPTTVPAAPLNPASPTIPGPDR